MKTFPHAAPDVNSQHWASFRKAAFEIGAINASRPPDQLRGDDRRSSENVAVMASSSFIRAKQQAPDIKNVTDPFQFVFQMLLRRVPNADEIRILGQLGAIQVHHGSAGSNMVARYFATLHTRSVSDLFTASQMALDCGRHFGAISDMTDFVRILERTPQGKRDDAIRDRIVKGSLPTFGHPEIAAADARIISKWIPRPRSILRHSSKRSTKVPLLCGRTFWNVCSS